MFSRKNKIRKIRFINLAEHLALQNDIVSRTMDSMLTHGPNNDSVKQPGDRREVPEADTFPASSLSGPKGPKSILTTTGQVALNPSADGR